MTTASPSTVGSVATRMSSIRPAAAAFSEMRPSCGFRRSAMSSFASTFRRVVTPAAIRFGIRCTSWRTPSIRSRTMQRVLLRLEMDVAGPVLGGLEDDRVDEPDERDVGDAVLDLEVVGLVLDFFERLLGLMTARAPNASEARSGAGSRRDVLARGDGQLELELVARRSSSIAWTFAGSATAIRSVPFSSA